jgi:hypothetical protein
MPQPALHILLGDAVLRHWRRNGGAPFDPRDRSSRSAFLAGTLGPDYGLFPGGLPVVSALAHTGRTGELARALLERARAPREQAFVWGSLTHVLADVAIHPLINRAAAEHAAAEGRTRTLHDHVRVEVGIDAWFGWRHPRLGRVRLLPVLDRESYRFASDAYHATHGCDVTPAQLIAMQRGMLRFTRLAIFFATSVARDLCWDECDAGAPAPLHATLAWHAALACSARTSTVHAYLKPVRPAAWLVDSVAAAMRRFTTDVDAHVASRMHQLPDWDLETGLLRDAEARVA